ncbi:MAG: hypothetical protein L6Q98_19015 [Anaerolineae bacterium]|nr:hypothetical protein [Anaerolineae bacterium]NUQ05453.1 hypothetical protein [Anaerolineae bacterium]
MGHNIVVNPTAESQSPAQDSIWITLSIALLFSFGLTLLVFTFFYVRDLRLLREIPEAVWAFICGTPREDGIVLPVLVLMSTLSFLSAAGIWGWRWSRRR